MHRRTWIQLLLPTPDRCLPMSDEGAVEAFNPLRELGVSQSELNQTLVEAFESQNGEKLPEAYNTFDGCGVYGLYYFGNYDLYRPISNNRGNYDLPIYVGKAVPSGSRTGGAHLESSSGRKLYKRLREHRKTIEAAENIDIDNFRCKYLITSSIWIRYAEQVLISYFLPWWNKYIDGFGIHHPGSGRAGQEESVWDALHPGREFVESLDLVSRGDPKEVWAEEVQPKINSGWSRDELKQISNSSSENDNSD